MRAKGLARRYAGRAMVGNVAKRSRTKFVDAPPSVVKAATPQWMRRWIMFCGAEVNRILQHPLYPAPALPGDVEGAMQQGGAFMFGDRPAEQITLRQFAFDSRQVR